MVTKLSLLEINWNFALVSACDFLGLKVDVVFLGNPHKGDTIDLNRNR